MKKVIIIIIIAVAVSVLGYFGYKIVAANSDEGILVEVMDVATMDITETVSATGKIKPEVEVSISPEVPGEIIELPIREGQAVQKGDLLAKINPDLLQSSVSRSRAGLANTKAGFEQAKASLVEAKANFQRASQLLIKESSHSQSLILLQHLMKEQKQQSDLPIFQLKVLEQQLTKPQTI